MARQVLYQVFPPMYRAGDRVYRVYSMYQAKKLIKRLYARGNGRGYEVWRSAGSYKTQWTTDLVLKF